MRGEVVSSQVYADDQNSNSNADEDLAEAEDSDQPVNIGSEEDKDIEWYVPLLSTTQICMIW